MQAAFDPLEFLRLADTLVTDDADEAVLRTAIGRAYYAVFLVAREKTGIHGRQYVHERVRTAISPSDSRLASILGTMASLRLIADYELVPRSPQDRNWRRNWQKTRRNAQWVIERLNALP
jgi:hypothetical protein